MVRTGEQISDKLYSKTCHEIYEGGGYAFYAGHIFNEGPYWGVGYVEVGKFGYYPEHPGDDPGFPRFTERKSFAVAKDEKYLVRDTLVIADHRFTSLPAAAMDRINSVLGMGADTNREKLNPEPEKIRKNGTSVLVMDEGRFEYVDDWLLYIATDNQPHIVSYQEAAKIEQAFHYREALEAANSGEENEAYAFSRRGFSKTKYNKDYSSIRELWVDQFIMTMKKSDKKSQTPKVIGKYVLENK